MGKVVKFKKYMHTSKESQSELASSLGLQFDNDEAEVEFIYGFYEVEVDAEVDTATGRIKVLAIDGKKVEQ